MNNYLLDSKGITILNRKVSNEDYYIPNEQLKILFNDSEARAEFLKKLGKPSVILTSLGNSDGEDVYKKISPEVLKVGEKKWL